MKEKIVKKIPNALTIIRLLSSFIAEASASVGTFTNESRSTVRIAFDSISS